MFQAFALHGNINRAGTARKRPPQFVWGLSSAAGSQEESRVRGVEEEQAAEKRGWMEKGKWLVLVRWRLKTVE